MSTPPTVLRSMALLYLYIYLMFVSHVASVVITEEKKRKKERYRALCIGWLMPIVSDNNAICLSALTPRLPLSTVRQQINLIRLNYNNKLHPFSIIFVNTNKWKPTSCRIRCRHASTKTHWVYWHCRDRSGSRRQCSHFPRTCPVCTSDTCHRRSSHGFI